jgi:hypothetical protein
MKLQESAAAPLVFPGESTPLKSSHATQLLPRK